MDRGTPREPASGGSGPPAPPARRFDEEEFGLILRKAAELQERGPEAGVRQRGLTLEEIRQIASEAGIDPRFIDQAVAALPAEWRRDQHVLLGAPYGWHFHRTVEGSIRPESLGRLLDAMRSVTRQKGDVTEVFGVMEWNYDDQLGPILVRVAPADTETRIEVSAQRGAEVGLWYGVMVPMGAITGGAALASALGVSGAEAIPLIVASGGASWLGVRALWSHLSARWERKLRTLVDRVGEAAQDSAEPSGPGEDAPGRLAAPGSDEGP